MKVSVVIATYNRAYILLDALMSVLDQSHRDFEILVVDDGSSDNTGEIVRGLEHEAIRYIRLESNSGCSAAYNVGIREATGEAIAILDSDDVWKPEYLERQVSFLRNHPEVGVVFCDTEIRGSSATIPSLISLMRAFPQLLHNRPKVSEPVFTAREMYLCLLEEAPIKPTAAVVRREIFSRAGLFNEAWPSGTDWDLYLRMSRIFSFGYIDEVLVIQRRTPDATHQKFREKDKVFLLELFLREKAALAGDRDALRSVNRGLSGIYNSLAWNYLESGQSKLALATYSRGFGETRRPMLLKKLLSGVVRVARELLTTTHARA